MDILQKTMLHVGKRMRHEVTGQEIKLLNPTNRGWRVHFVSATAPPDRSLYDVFLDTDTLNRKFKDVPE